MRSETSRLRLKGYRAALRGPGSPGIAVLEIPNNEWYPAGFVAATDHLPRTGDELPDAMVCMTDSIAIGALSALWTSAVGCRRTSRSSVTTTSPTAAFAVPPLTTIDFDKQVYATTVLDLLEARISHPEPSDRASDDAAPAGWSAGQRIAARAAVLTAVGAIGCEGDATHSLPSDDCIVVDAGLGSRLQRCKYNDVERLSPMPRARLVLDAAFALAPVPHRLFGSFVEHMGRCVYTGIYEPGHPTADAAGFRGDVLELTREIGPTVVRYPGGNFVSGYRWEDGIGPVDERPTRLDLAWRTTEPNTVGIHEFDAWARAVDTEVMMAVNLGTRGLQEACDLLEYTNHPGGPSGRIAGSPTGPRIRSVTSSGVWATRWTARGRSVTRPRTSTVGWPPRRGGRCG